MNAQKSACIEALGLFIADSSNENKLELHLAYDAIGDEEKIQVLGAELAAVLHRILDQNDHPDAFLAQIKASSF